MRRVDEYKQHAKDCREVAARTTHPQDKVALEVLAKDWDKIAALRKRDLEDADDS
jgi:hypothetical protein